MYQNYLKNISQTWWFVSELVSSSEQNFIFFSREQLRIDDETEYLRYVYNASKFLSKAMVSSLAFCTFSYHSWKLCCRSEICFQGQKANFAWERADHLWMVLVYVPSCMWTFIPHQHVHIFQKKNIAPKIAANQRLLPLLVISKNHDV